jgi:hypothetical protein
MHARLRARQRLVRNVAASFPHSFMGVRGASSARARHAQIKAKGFDEPNWNLNGMGGASVEKETAEGSCESNATGWCRV